MSDEFVIWKWSEIPKWSIALLDLVNFPDSFRLHHGVPLANTFPHDVAMTTDPDHPRDTIPTDNLFNSNRILVVSQRLKIFLEGRALVSVEYLPISILDLKGKPIPDHYFIINPLDHLSCLDIKQSQAIHSRIDTRRIKDVKRLVLDPEKLDYRRELFRIENFNRVTLVSRALAKAIDEVGFTSICWTELRDYRP